MEETLSQLRIIDAVLLLPILYYAFKGFRAGLIAQVAHFLSFILALYVAFTFQEKVGEFIAQYFPVEGRTLYVISLLLLFFAALWGSRKLAEMITSAISVTPLAILNTAGGAVFGGLLCMLIVGFLCGMVFKLQDMFTFIDIEQLSNSIAFQKITFYSDTVLDAIGGDEIWERLKGLKENVQENIAPKSAPETTTI